MDTVAAHPQGGGARFGQRQDRLATEVVRGEQRAHRNRLVNPAEAQLGEVGIQGHVLGQLGLPGNRRHLLDGFHRVLAGGGFGAEHHRIGAVEYRIGNIADLGPRRHRVEDHRLHHLGRGDGHLVEGARHLDHAFLQRRHGRIAYLDRQIAARHHDAVTGLQDRLQMRDRFRALDLGDQAWLVPPTLTRHIAQLARHLHVGGVLRKADRHVLGLEAHRRLDVIHVLGGQRRGGQPAALLVDALVVRQLTAHLDGGVHRRAAHRIDRQHQQAVVEQEGVTGLHIARQFLVIQAHSRFIAKFGALGVEDERSAVDQLDLAVLELADANLRALQVGHDGYLLAGCPGRFAHHRRPVDVVLRLAMREVQAHHVHTRPDHPLQDLRRVGGRAEGGNDLGGSGHGGLSFGWRQTTSGQLWAAKSAGQWLRRVTASAGLTLWPPTHPPPPAPSY